MAGGRRCPVRRPRRTGRRPAQSCPGITSKDDVAREQYLSGIAAEGFTVPMENVSFAGKLIGRATHKVPVLSESGCRAQCSPLAIAADADRRVRTLNGLGLVAGVTQLVVLAVEG